MSWHFSAALAAAYSAACSTAGAPSAPSRSKSTPAASSCSASATASSRPSPSGTTSPLSTDGPGTALLTWFRAASRVRISPVPAVAADWPAPAPACGATWPVLLATYDRSTSSWKTVPGLPVAVSRRFSATFPKWGMMHGTAYYQLPTPSGLMAHRAWITSASASGSSRMPTPHGFSQDGRSNGPSGNELGRAVNRLPSPRASAADRVGNSNKHFARLPTPLSGDARRGDCESERQRVTPCLASQINRLPTPCATPPGSNQGGAAGRVGPVRPSLDVLIKRLPTPVACISKGSSPASLTRKNGRSRATDRLDHAIMASDGGSLNPSWVEWLMGLPIEWSASRPLAISSFRQWWRSHGRR